MAIIKEIQTKYGINADYWTIHYLRIDTVSKNGYLIVRGYANENVSDFEPLEEIEFNESIPEDIRTDFFKTFIYERDKKVMTITRELDNTLPIDPNWILTYVYNMLKTKERFIGAIDVGYIPPVENQLIEKPTIEDITANESNSIEGSVETPTENTPTIEPITI